MYNAQNGYAYVVSSGPYSTYGNVSVLNGASIVRTIGVGGGPNPPVYDSRNGFVYIQNTADANVSVLNGTTLVATIAVGQSDFAAGIIALDWGSYVPVAGYPAYDPDNGFVYVPNSVTDNVSVLNGTSVIASIPVGSVPLYANFDPTNGYVYITNDNNNCYPGECSRSGNVTVLNGTNIVGAVGVGLFPSEPTIGPNGDLYVPNAGSCDPYSYSAGCDSANVTVIDGTTVVGNVSVGSEPFQAVSDPRNGFVYVSQSESFGSENLTVINGTSILAQVDVFGVEGPASYDAANGLLYLGNGDLRSRHNFTVINGTSVVGSIPLNQTPFGSFFDPANGCVYALSGNVEVVCPEGVYNVTFAPQGLPLGTTWSLTLENSTESGSGNLTFDSVATGSYAYTLGPISGYHSDVVTGNLLLGASAFQPVPFYPDPPPAYAVTFTEVGLPSGMEWSVTLGSEMTQSSAASLSFLVPNGTAAFSVAGLPRWTTSSFHGNVTVLGQPVSVRIAWLKENYPVIFQESGLYAGTQWEVGLGPFVQNSTTSTIEFMLTNGTYNFSVGGQICYRVNLTVVEVKVSGLSGDVRVEFTWLSACGPFFAVVFEETGLGSGTPWTVTLNGTTEGSSPIGIAFAEANGSYNFTVGRVLDFAANVTTGRVTVAGRTQFVQLGFRSTASTFRVTFAEAGLVGGTFWAASLGREANGSSGTQISFTEQNGTFPFMITILSGYSGSPLEGNLTVSGANVTELVTFRSTLTSPPSSETSTPSFLGLPGDLGYVLVGALAALAMAGLGIVLQVYQRKVRPPPS